jgi:hypothetical protein
MWKDHGGTASPYIAQLRSLSSSGAGSVAADMSATKDTLVMLGRGRPATCHPDVPSLPKRARTALQKFGDDDENDDDDGDDHGMEDYM